MVRSDTDFLLRVWEKQTYERGAKYTRGTTPRLQTQHRKLKTKQHEPQQKLGVISFGMNVNETFQILYSFHAWLIVIVILFFVYIYSFVK